MTGVAVGDRVLGAYGTACAECFFCARGDFHKCDRARVFGHGELLGSLQGSQAELLLVPTANLTLRRIPDGMTDEVAIFAGDVMGTGYHAVVETGVTAGSSVAVLGLGPVGLCAVQAAIEAGAENVIAIDTVEARLELARGFGATRGPPHRGGPARSGEVDDRRTRGGRRDRRRRPRRRAQPGLPAHPQDGLGLGHRGLRRADRAAHGHRLAEGADAQDRPRERDRPPRPGARAARLGRARPRAARHPPDGARRGTRGVRPLRPPRGAEDHADP